MKPPAYKTVTTKEGVMLFVGESATIKDGDWYYSKDDDGIRNFMPEKEDLPLALKVIAQPLESNLSGIPYYELTPQEETFTEEDMKKAFQAGGEYGAELMGSTACIVGLQPESPDYDTFISSLRPKKQIVSAKPVMEKQMCECAFEQEKDICIYPNCVKPSTYKLDEHPDKIFLKLEYTFKQD